MHKVLKQSTATFIPTCPTAPPQGGHYVTYVKCRDGAWYLCDDAFISPASCEEVQNSQAYLLFYMDKSIDPWTVQ